MSEALALQEIDEVPAAAGPARSRMALMKRLADVVCLPTSRVNQFERSMTADLLVEMLRDSDPASRARVAKRLSPLKEIPTPLVRLLLRDMVEVARPLLTECAAINDSDLIRCVREAAPEHARLIAGRRQVSEVVSEAIVEAADPQAIDLLLRNPGARLSQPGIEALVAASRDRPEYIPLLLKRQELRPSQAYVMFWWCGAEDRKTILTRFAVSREVLQDAAADVFPMAADEGWSDPMSRKALQFIERRQRNRAAIEKSPYESLEDACNLAQNGLSREMAEELSYLSGVKPMTGAKIFTDAGGEPLAILCKATGLPKAGVRALWRGMKRPEADEQGRIAPALEHVFTVYDMVAVDRAQTVLRYWNWSLSSALTPELLKAIKAGDEEAVDELSPPQRAAMLAWAQDLRR